MAEVINYSYLSTGLVNETDEHHLEQLNTTVQEVAEAVAGTCRTTCYPAEPVHADGMVDEGCSLTASISYREQPEVKFSCQRKDCAKAANCAEAAELLVSRLATAACQLSDVRNDLLRNF